MPRTRGIQFAVRLDDEERAMLDRLAKRAGMHASDCVRLLIREADGDAAFQLIPRRGRPKEQKERAAGSRVTVDRYEVVRINAAFGTTWRMYLPCGHKTVRAIGRQVDPETPGAREITKGVFCIGVPESVRCNECKRQAGAGSAEATVQARTPKKPRREKPAAPNTPEPDADVDNHVAGLLAELREHERTGRKPEIERPGR